MAQFQENDKSVREIIGRLSTDFSDLVRKEIDLGKAELEQKLSHAAKQVASMAVGGAVLYAGLLGLLTAAILALSLVMAAWLAALLVGIVVTLTGGALVMKGKRGIAKQELKPTQTARSVRRDLQVMKEAMQ